MKYSFELAAGLLLSGCAMDVSPDDRDFFYGGWTRPERAAQERMYGLKHAAAFPPADPAHHPASDVQPPR